MYVEPVLGQDGGAAGPPLGPKVPLGRTKGPRWDRPSPTKRWFQRSELAGAEQRAGQMQERREEVSAALVADRQASVGQQPGQGPLHLPAVAAQPLTELHPRRAIRGVMPRRRRTLRQSG